MQGSRGRRPARARTLVVAASAALVLGGCGTGPAATAEQAVDPSDSACRAQWQQLAGSLAGKDQQVDSSDLAPRWNAVIATAQYYATSANTEDCGAPLAAQQATIGQIRDLSTRLRRFDIGHLMSSLAPQATDYLLRPLPAPRTTHGHKQRPPSKREVRLALTTLQDQATLSATDMSDGWDEANSIDLSDPAAIRRTVRDLAFLAQDSTPFQRCLQALTVLRRAAAFGAGTPGSGP